MDDTIEVRADEGFDEGAVAAYLRGRLPGSEGALRVRQFGGGAANLTYLLAYGAQEYVLRRPPLGPVAKSAHDMGREFRVLSRLHEAFAPAPKAFLYCEDNGVIGAPFLVMERRRGVVVRRSVPAVFKGMAGAPRQMSEGLVDTLVDFHAVDYEALGLGGLGKPEGFVARQVEGWHGRWQKAKHEEVSAMEVVYAWLRANVPVTTQFSLVHNDYKLDNVMLDPGDPGRVTAVFDWDMCTLGDPLLDLGALLTYWTEATDPPAAQMMAMMPIGDLGFMTRAELVARYAARSGRSVSDIRFYHVLGLFRVVVILAQIYIRYVRGQTQDQRFEMMGQMVPLMAAQALDIIEAE